MEKLSLHHYIPTIDMLGESYQKHCELLQLCIYSTVILTQL